MNECYLTVQLVWFWIYGPESYLERERINIKWTTRYYWLYLTEIVIKFEFFSVYEVDKNVMGCRKSLSTHPKVLKGRFITGAEKY